MRFNPPPNWPPAPPGWTPPPGWQPDPSWPPLPPGWPLWVDQAAPPRRTVLVLGALGAVLLVAAAAVVIVAATRDRSVSDPTPTTAAALSDEDQIHRVVEQFEQAWNDEDFNELQQLMCDEVRTSGEFSQAWLHAALTEIGRLNLSVTELDITGDIADTVIENNGADPDDIAFAREDGDWKWCEI